MTKCVLRMYVLVVAIFLIGLFFLQMDVMESESRTEGFRDNFPGQTTRVSRHSPNVSSHNLEFNSTHAHVKTNSFSFVWKNELCNATLLNNTRFAAKEILYFNRVAKVGSESVMTLLYYLAFQNKFRYYVNGRKSTANPELNYYEENRLNSMIDALPAPALYARHSYFSNSSRSSHGRRNPIYCNMVRDPVERVISWYYYKRSPWVIGNQTMKFPHLPVPTNDWLKKDYETCVLQGDAECTYFEMDHESNNSNSSERRIDEMINQLRFFCGHGAECGIFNGEWAMQEAKKNVEKSYAVVGVLEHFDISLEVFEAYIPKFFKGVSEMYHGGTILNVVREAYLTTVKEYENKLEPYMYKLEEKGLWRQIGRDVVDNYSFKKKGMVFKYQVLSG